MAYLPSYGQGLGAAPPPGDPAKVKQLEAQLNRYAGTTACPGCKAVPVDGVLAPSDAVLALTIAYARISAAVAAGTADVIGGKIAAALGGALASPTLAYAYVASHLDQMTAVLAGYADMHGLPPPRGASAFDWRVVAGALGLLGVVVIARRGRGRRRR